MEIFVIYDRKAEVVRSLFTARDTVSAVRGVVGTVGSGAADLSQFPGDFELRRIGACDERLSTLIPADVNEVIGSVEALVASSGLKKGGSRDSAE